MPQSEASSRRIKFRHLVCFLEVARLRSVVKAAQTLGVSQPAVSKTLHELEEELQIALFDRTHRNGTLTRFGEVFLQHAGASVAALNQGIDLINQTRSGAPTVVKVGALPTVSARILPRAVELFMRDALGATVRIVTGPNVFLMNQLRLGDVDFVVGRMAEPEIMRGLSFEHLYLERVVFVARMGHPLMLKPSFEPAALRAFPCLLPPPGSAILPAVERFLLAHGISGMPTPIETVSTSFGVGFTRRTDAIWIISEGVVAEHIADAQLQVLPLDTSAMIGSVGLTHRPGNPLSLPAELLINAIREVAAPSKVAV